MSEEVVKLLGIGRHRLGCDGEGITTLVTLRQCPLNCKYCINPDCHVMNGDIQSVTASEIVRSCMKDNLYFISTGGGITLGGGEPLLHPKFIRELRDDMPEGWKLNLETSLNVPIQNVEAVIDSITYWFIDIKDMNPDIYESYTMCSNKLVLDNLNYIAKRKLQGKCLVRLPYIPDFNTDDDRKKSQESLIKLGFEHFDLFNYIV